MEEVDDQADEETGIVERRADRSGIAAGKRRHGVEEVGDAGQPGGPR